MWQSTSKTTHLTLDCARRTAAAVKAHGLRAEPGADVPTANARMRLRCSQSGQTRVGEDLVTVVFGQCPLSTEPRGLRGEGRSAVIGRWIAAHRRSRRRDRRMRSISVDRRDETNHTDCVESGCMLGGSSLCHLSAPWLVQCKSLRRGLTIRLDDAM